MVAVVCFLQTELGAPCGDFQLVIDVANQRVAQVECARHAVHECNHVDGEACLQLRQFEQVVHDHVGVGIALESDDEVGFATRRVVVDVGDAIQVAAIDQFLNTCGDCRATSLVRKFGNDDQHLALAALFNAHLRAHLDAAAAGVVGVSNTVATKNGSTRWEVGALDKLHQVGGCCFGVFDEMQSSVDYFAQVVRRDAGGHAHGNALASVDEQVGKACWQNNWFFGCSVVSGNEVDRVFVDVGQQLHGKWVQARLGVTAGGRAEVWRTIVAVEVDERVAQRKWLRHAHECVVNGAVTVRVIAGHGVTSDAGTLYEWAVGAEALLVHVPNDSAVNRLEAVANVGQCARHDDRHCVIEE